MGKDAGKEQEIAGERGYYKMEQGIQSKETNSRKSSETVGGGTGKWIINPTNLIFIS